MSRTEKKPFKPLEQLDQALISAGRAWLFFDYDGTLAEFAPTPADVLPDPEIIEYITRLARHPRVRVTILSGRTLQQIQQLVPVRGICAAGTYGIEVELFDGARLHRVAVETVRPTLDSIKKQFEEMLAGREGFFLEDKGWALAVHARFAEENEAEWVLDQARAIAERKSSPELFRWLGGHRFFEVSAKLGNKGLSVIYLLERLPWPGAALAYFGDDDKDEEAFQQVNARGGMSVVISAAPRESQAAYRIESPGAMRRWLRTFIDAWYRAYPVEE